jgi:hypothetical protein
MNAGSSELLRAKLRAHGSAALTPTHATHPPPAPTPNLQATHPPTTRNQGCAEPGAVQCQVHAPRAPEQAQKAPRPQKNWRDKQVSGWRHISCHTDKNRYYT